MINYKIHGISFSIPSGVTTIGDGISGLCPSVGNHGTMRAQGSLENIKMGLGAQIGDRVATQMKIRTHCTTTRFHGST